MRFSQTSVLSAIFWWNVACPLITRLCEKKWRNPKQPVKNQKDYGIRTHDSNEGRANNVLNIFTAVSLTIVYFCNSRDFANCKQKLIWFKQKTKQWIWVFLKTSKSQSLDTIAVKNKRLGEEEKTPPPTQFKYATLLPFFGSTGAVYGSWDAAAFPRHAS